ncbi:MAG: class I SAM-dependent methyltransferase [Elusimicrobia bacterium]|nr:class I SAM-dependent methyltransferase [Elusimicrobiota bacterium]
MIQEKDIRSSEALTQYLDLVRRDVERFFGGRDGFAQVSCLACQGRSFSPAFEKIGFSYVLCDDCGTLFVNPRPTLDQLREFYVDSPSSRFWVEGFFKPVAEARREAIFKPRAQFVAERLSEKQLRCVGDIGAGFGLFLEELARLKPQGRYVAIEPSPEMAAICRDKNIEVAEAMVEDLEGYDGAFSLLTCFELLEHLYEPEVLMRQAYRLLAPGGVFLATTLNGQGFDIQVLWERSNSVYPPHHINFFNPSSLSRLARRAGFFVEDSDTPGQLDWSIVEGIIHRDRPPAERFWSLLAKQGSADCKRDFQTWIAHYGFSSHMRVILRKPE